MSSNRSNQPVDQNLRLTFHLKSIQKMTKAHCVWRVHIITTFLRVQGWVGEVQLFGECHRGFSFVRVLLQCGLHFGVLSQLIDITSVFWDVICQGMYGAKNLDIYTLLQLSGYSPTTFNRLQEFRPKSSFSNRKSHDTWLHDPRVTTHFTFYFT